MYFKVNMISNCSQDDLNLSVMKNTHILKTGVSKREYYSDIKLFRIGRRGSIFVLLVETDGLHDHSGHRIGVAVAAWSPVLQVAVPLLGHLPRDPNVAAPVCDAGREVVDRRSLVGSGQTTLVVLSLFGIICLDVPHMVLGELLNSRLNCFDAASNPHRLSGEVCVSSSTIPVAHHRLGIKSNNHTKVFSYPLQNVPGDPEVVSHINPLGWSNLELPLRRHHLSICARDPDASIETGPVVGLHNVPSVHISSSNSTVVRPLGPRETILGPSEGVAVLAQKSVLLFNAKPRVLVFCLVHDLVACFSVVGLRWLLVVLVGFAHHHDIVAAPEWIPVHLDRVEISVGIAALGLIAGATIIVPDWEIRD